VFFAGAAGRGARAGGGKAHGVVAATGRGAFAGSIVYGFSQIRVCGVFQVSSRVKQYPGPMLLS
jgi:hypothetical protein